MNSWQQQYLAALQTSPSTPTLDALRSLIRRHLHVFPFENISKFRYYEHRGRSGLHWLPDIDTFLHHFEQHGLGGNCYILNYHFGQLLAALGYQVDLVRASGGNTHLALMVTLALDGQPYYVDVGYGAPLFEPLRLEEEPRFARYGEEVDIRRLAPRQFMIDRRTNGQSIVTKTIEWQPVSLDRFDDIITHSLRDEADNPFMRRITATRFQDNAAYTVINNKLFVKKDSGTELHAYTDEADWIAMMRTTFRFDPAVLHESLVFLAARGVRLFD
ncbi:arylamine N-acetyltransferase [Paenibacillus aurantiacus]|uniref:Arylamine N-acetyltransferase n=1 Tax=Paenibacillus aurantiacus TaxID=1936118 RepID=A0ABV5KHL8_9BACL